MCYPAIPYIIAAGASLYQGYSQYEQGKFEEGVSQYNARQLENEATATRNKGVEAENIHREEVLQKVARQKAQTAANGLNINAGTALDIRSNTETIGEADALRIRGNYSDSAQTLDDQSKLSLAKGKAAMKAGKASLITGVLGAASSGAKGFNA